MSALELEIAETLKTLDPARARAFERALHDLLSVVRRDEAGPEATKAAAVDANGWPLGYWEKFAGCLAGDDWEPAPDPPPEDHPW